MTNDMLESNMRDAGLYLLMFVSTTAGVALSVVLIHQFTSFTAIPPPDLFIEATAFATFMGGGFLFLWKETILSFGTKRRVWSIVLMGLSSGIVTASTRSLFEAMFQA